MVAERCSLPTPSLPCRALVWSHCYTQISRCQEHGESSNGKIRKGHYAQFPCSKQHLAHAPSPSFYPKTQTHEASYTSPNASHSVLLHRAPVYFSKMRLVHYVISKTRNLFLGRTEQTPEHKLPRVTDPDGHQTRHGGTQNAVITEDAPMSICTRFFLGGGDTTMPEKKFVSI